MKSIEEAISINASVEKVWEIFTDFENHKAWNPFIVYIKGQPEKGAQLEIKVKSAEGKSTSFKTKINSIKEKEALSWKGHAGFKSMLEAEHCFQFAAQDDGTTLFTQSETFEGLLTAVIDSEIKETKEGFKEMNKALKKHCEA
ncbi:MAG: SRPBCC domain-containing protein [Chitinophagales bacterium]